MSEPVKTRWGAGGHQNARGASGGDIATMPAGDAFAASIAAKRSPPALAAPGCPRWRSSRGCPIPPWPRVRTWLRAGAAAAGARHALTSPLSNERVCALEVFPCPVLLSKVGAMRNQKSVGVDAEPPSTPPAGDRLEDTVGERRDCGAERGH